MRHKKCSTHIITTSHTLTTKTTVLKRKETPLLHRLVLTSIVLICFSTLTLLVFIPFLQLTPWNNLNWFCQYEFFNKNWENIFQCKLRHEVETRTHNKRWLKRLSESPSYFYDPLSIELWGRDEDKTLNNEVILGDFNNKPIKAFATDPYLEAEAIAALEVGKRLRKDGNIRRAKTIVEHAYSLSPHHPDILTEYGFLIEIAHNDLVSAEGFYRRALAKDPQHTEALIRRAKTLPLVNEIDQKMLQEIHRKRDKFVKIPRTDPALKRALRESYFQHVYHTVALEGNTISILETRMAVAGKSIIEHNEILGMDAALRFLNQTLAHVGGMKLGDILAIHKRVLGFVDPLAAGIIRTTQVYVGSFTPTPPEQIYIELEDLITWLNDEETLSIDPIELAALAHYKLVFIHPFIDGNGRTSRLLMNFILMQAGFPPVIIPVEQRSRYYLTLQQANEGDLRPFIRFIAEQTDRTLDGFIASTSVCTLGDNECGLKNFNDQDIKEFEFSKNRATIEQQQPQIPIII